MANGLPEQLIAALLKVSMSQSRSKRTRLAQQIMGISQYFSKPTDCATLLVMVPVFLISGHRLNRRSTRRG